MYGLIKEKLERLETSPLLSEGTESYLIAMALITTAAEIIGWNVFIKADDDDDDAHVRAIGIQAPVEE